MRILALSSPAQMPGDPTTLENRGRCVVNEIIITRIVDDSAQVGDPTVRYTVGVGSDMSFAEFCDNALLETTESRFWHINTNFINS